MKKNQNQAFSLIELSIVLIIIGLLIAGIVGGKSLINASKLSSARALTNSSPVTGMEDLTLWLETTSKKSFSKAQPDDDEIITTWRDINSQSVSKRNATASTGPTYKNNLINNLPALNFDGVNDFFNYDGSFLINSDMTVFVVEQRRSGDEIWYIGSINSTDGLRMGYTSVGHAVAYGSSNATAPFSLGVFYSSPVPRMHVMVMSQNSPGNAADVYVNGAHTAITLPSIDEYDTPVIGRYTSFYYEGDIAEIIMFSRKLSEFEIDEIEKYLAKKWGIELS